MSCYVIASTHLRGFLGSEGDIKSATARSTCMKMVSWARTLHLLQSKYNPVECTNLADVEKLSLILDGHDFPITAG